MGSCNFQYPHHARLSVYFYLDGVGTEHPEGTAQCQLLQPWVGNQQGRPGGSITTLCLDDSIFPQIFFRQKLLHRHPFSSSLPEHLALGEG